MTQLKINILPVNNADVLLQRLLAVVLEIMFVVFWMGFWLLTSEAVIGTSVNQTWEIIAIIGVIPLYIFLVTTGLVIGLLVDWGVTAVRLAILGLLLLFCWHRDLTGSGSPTVWR